MWSLLIIIDVKAYVKYSLRFNIITLHQSYETVRETSSNISKEHKSFTLQYSLMYVTMMYYYW